MILPSIHEQANISLPHRHIMFTVRQSCTGGRFEYVTINIRTTYRVVNLIIIFDILYIPRISFFHGGRDVRL